MSKQFAAIALTVLSLVSQVKGQESGLTVTRVESGLHVGTERNAWHMRLEISFELRIAEPEVIPVLADFSVRDEATGAALAALPTTAIDVISEGSIHGADGVITVTMPIPNAEPQLTLVWDPSRTPPKDNANGEKGVESEPLTIGLNTEFRRLRPLTVDYLGPGATLAVVKLAHNADIIFAWVLQEPLAKILRNGTERLVICSADEPAISMADEFSMWAGQLQPSTEARGQAMAGMLPRPSLRFRSVSAATIAGAPSSTGFRAVRGLRRFATLDDALADGLTPVYRFAPIEQAIADLNSPIPGLRRAAIAGAVDRLTAQQTHELLEKIRPGDETVQLEVASFLHQIPGAEAISVLKDLSLGKNATLASTALNGLASSRDDAAESAMAEVWAAGEGRPQLRSLAIAAMVRADDDRWVPLVAAWNADSLAACAADETTTVSREHLAAALEFLRLRKHNETAALVRRLVVWMRNPFVQDELITYLLREQKGEDGELLRSVVDQRVSNRKISQPVRTAASLLKRSEWTEALLEEYRRGSATRSLDRGALHVALQCASEDQLTKLAEDASLLPASARAELLVHLSAVEHSAWKNVARELVSRPGSEASIAAQLLALDASEESLGILRSSLQEYVKNLEGTSDASVEGQQYFQILMAQMSAFVHPECRRLVNQLSRNPNDFVRARAQESIEMAMRRSPAMPLLVMEYQNRKAGKADEARAALEQALQMDPFLSELRVRRASNRMHAGQFQDSMDDLKAADQLSPENTEVLSMIALVKVRMGEIENGLTAAEELISSAGKDWTALYNGACTYARATEQPGVAEDAKTRYADRAILLLNLSADVKFTDHEHMQVDADLLSLHSHPKWPEVVARVKANAERGDDE